MKELAVEISAVLVAVVLFANMNGVNRVESAFLGSSNMGSSGHTEEPIKVSLSDEVILPASPDAIPFPAPRIQRG